MNTTMQKVANLNGYNYYVGEGAKGKFYNIAPDTQPAPNGGYYSKEYILGIKQLPDLFERTTTVENFEVSQEPPQKQYAPLREIMVYYKNGGKDNAPFSQGVSMAAHLTDKEMLDYFAPGAVFNVGAGEFDCMAEVERAEIIL